MAPVFLLVRDSELGGTQPFVGADGLLRLHPFDRRTASFIHWEGGVLHRQPKDVVGRLLADWEQFCPSSRNPAVGVRSHHGSLGPHKSPPRGGSHRYPAQGTAGRARAAYSAAGKDPVETPSPHAAATRIGRRQASAGVLPLTESNSVLWHPSRNRRLHCVCGTSMSISISASHPLSTSLSASTSASESQPQPPSLSLS